MSNGFVQLLEADLQGLLDDGVADGVGDLRQLGASEPPALLSTLIQTVASDPQLKQWLRMLGRHIALRGIGELKEALFGRPSPPSPWMEAFMPLIAEVEEGVVSTLKAKGRPWAWGIAGVAALGAFGLGAFIGASRRRLYERGRTAR